MIHYRTIFTAPQDTINHGRLLNTGDSLILSLDAGKYDYPVKRRIRIMGGGKFPAPYHQRNEEVFRTYLYLIDDCLDTTDSYKEKYSLLLHGEGETFERSIYYRLSEHEFRSGPAQLIIPVKAGSLDKKLFCEIEFYQKKEDIHPDDIYDTADAKTVIEIPGGTYDWKEINANITIPSNTACILFHLYGKNFSGNCRIATPQFLQNGKTSPLPSLKPYSGTPANWFGINLSSKEWPEFECRINNKTIFSGKVFDRASEVNEFEIDLPRTLSGSDTLTILNQKKFPVSYPYVIRQVDLIEESARDFEIAFVPEFVIMKKEFGVLIETNKADLDLSIRTTKGISPLQNKIHLASTGWHVLKFAADTIAISPRIYISDGSRNAETAIHQVLQKNDDHIILSTTDDIYINHDKEYFGRWIGWYCSEGIGNGYGWRPSYQWNGTHTADSAFYRWANSLLSDLDMPYSLMIEGRSLTEKDVNPTDAMMASPFYMGRQAHENDGGFYYWGQFRYIGVFTDLMAKLRVAGGIFPKTRIIRNQNETSVYYDHYACKNMSDGAQQFVNNIRNARGQSTRHTGPSTLFRYFLQAGYSWVGAEQMYGPEDVILSSLRGACKAYGRNGFGTHLATQWGSGPFDEPEHASRLFLSLALSYMHGATHINTEDGLWNTEDGKDRYTTAGKEHIGMQKKMLDYILTHERRGNFVALIAFVQGRNDGWRCFARGQNVWGQKGDDWKFGPAEESFDLLKVFYPQSSLDAVYKFPCPKEEPGWYTGMPYGPVDLMPIEAPEDVINTYTSIVLLGWNSFMEEDFVRLLKFVKQGGTLLLSRPNINAELNHGKPARLPVSRTLDELLGTDFATASGIVRRSVEKGKVIYFADNVYPSDTSVRPAFEKELRLLGENIQTSEKEKGWIKGNNLVSFTVYDRKENGQRKIYLLNTDWWSGAGSHEASLMLGSSVIPLSVRKNTIGSVDILGDYAVIPSGMQTDIISMNIRNDALELIVQTTADEELIICRKSDGKKISRKINGAGLHSLLIKF